MTPLADGGHAIDIHALECDDEVIAIYAGVADGYRFSMMFNTYTMSGNSRHSPGLVLMRNIVDHYAERGYHTLDLGVGSDDYKKLFCKGDEPIFDCFIPLSLRGRVTAAAMSRINRAKHLVKHTPRCFRWRSCCEARFAEGAQCRPQAATTRGPGSTASEGCDGLLSIVTPRNPPL